MVPASILQILNSELIISGGVAADITYNRGVRAHPFNFPDYAWQIAMAQAKR